MKKIIPIIITIVLGAIMYYVMLPPINLKSPDFYPFLLIIIILYIIINELSRIKANENIILNSNFKENNKKYYWLVLIPIGFGLIVLINLFYSPLFNAKKYYERINVLEDGVFEEDVEEVDFKKIPLLDKSSSQKLGDRVMGQMTELVSQFYVSNLYTQINYNNDIVRVTPLEYANIIKYFTNRKEGVKGYIVLNSTDGKTELKKLDKGMKYMPSALFNDKLYRKLRFDYPTTVFGKERFELDNEGNPYWVVPTIKYKGVGLLRDISGVVILDPITGKSKKYNLEEIPTWVDHVYSPDLVLEQVNDWGRYAKGFFNSVFGQEGVVATTEGYNYMVMNDDVYLYTGITSVATDESNLGFILTNLRTKETDYYKVSGAEEFSAMASAEGQVQQMQYKSTFPLLINLNDKPTYLMSLKDRAGLVKMYAFVDVVDYQKVVVTEAQEGIEKASLNYLGQDKTNIKDDKLITKEIIISKIKTALIEGNTYYYLVDKNNNKYKIPIKVSPNLLPFLEVNDKLTVSYQKEEEIIEIIKIIKIK